MRRDADNRVDDFALKLVVSFVKNEKTLMQITRGRERQREAERCIYIYRNVPLFLSCLTAYFGSAQAKVPFDF